MTKQALGQRAVETFNNGLISVNFSAAAANVCLVAFHFFGHRPHKLAARVDLQHLRPRQRTAPVNRLESLRDLGRVFGGQRLGFFETAGDVDNSQCVFVNLPAPRKLVMWQKMKVRLVYRVGRRHVKFRARDVSRRREIDLPESLLDEPPLGGIFRHVRGFCQFFDGRGAFPVALGAVVDFGELGLHYS